MFQKSQVKLYKMKEGKKESFIRDFKPCLSEGIGNHLWRMLTCVYCPLASLVNNKVPD